MEDLVSIEQKPSQAGNRMERKHGASDWTSPAQGSELLRFCTSGIAATLFYFVIVNLLIYGPGLTPVVSSTLAYLMALGVSYFLQARYTFRIDSDSFDQVVKFLLSAIVGIGLSSGVMYLATHTLQCPALIASIIVCILIPISNYFVFKFWVFATRT
ncbi:MAG: GtrA family protein [Hyphomicrobiaceae bacterium]